MSKTAVITARLDPTTLALVDRIASAQGRSRSWFVERAIREAAEREAEFEAFIQAGIDAIDRGEYHTQEEMEAWLEERIAARSSAQAAE